jgi:hypothetical protein
MPIKELLALSVMIMGSIFVAHPFDFQNAIRKVEVSILKEISRTDNWGDPSFSGARKYIRAQHFEHRKPVHTMKKATSPKV